MFYLRYKDNNKNEPYSCSAELQWIGSAAEADLMGSPLHIVGYGASKDEALESFVANYKHTITKLLDELKKFESAIPVSVDTDESGYPIIINSLKEA